MLIIAQKTIGVQSLIYQISQNKGGKPLVFLHGWRQNKSSWAQTLESFDQAGFYVVAPDLPGFGQSPKPPDSWGVPEYAELIKKFTADVIKIPPVIIGHSFGGRIGIHLAAHYPETITSLILVNSAGFKPPLHMVGTLAGATKRLLQKLQLKSLEHIARTLLYRMVDVSDYANSGDMKIIFQHVTGRDLSREMKRIHSPTLIIHGQQDNMVPIDSAYKMHVLIQNSQFEVIPDTGHFVHQEKPELFFGLVTSFIKRHEF